MTLTPDHLEKLCAVAIDAATRTGKYVFKTRPENVEHKHNGGSLATQVVTEVDRESQRQIVQMLAPSMAQYDLALLAEESPDDGSRLIKDFFWCIDPIDGTLCFIEGAAGYAVSIALVARDGVPYIGVVYDPVARVLYHAIRGAGAFRNGVAWQPDLKRTTAPLQVFTDRSEANGERFLPTIKALDATVTAYGGGVLNALWCLDNAPACYFKFPKPNAGGGCFWDFAATACIYSEVGAWASDAHGQALELNRKRSVHLNHCGILYASDVQIAERFFSLVRTAT
ncbi:MAG: 3'(2'),5'-bisphosphate nucleotidase CysQ [Gammaproteobacteria bacterium]